MIIIFNSKYETRLFLIEKKKKLILTNYYFDIVVG